MLLHKTVELLFSAIAAPFNSRSDKDILKFHQDCNKTQEFEVLGFYRNCKKILIQGSKHGRTVESKTQRNRSKC